MPSCVSVRQTGELILDAVAVAPDCPSGLLILSKTDFSNMTTLDPVALGITSSSIGEVFTWGFGALIFCWSAGFVLSIALGLIRKA